MTREKNGQLQSRELVLDMLVEILEHDRYSHLVLAGVLDKHQYLSKQERAFITRLTEGTIEKLLELDYVINTFSRVRTEKMKPLIREIMRLGVYQILYMDSVPDSAAVNTCVSLAKKRGFRQLSGFVNGVLRTVARERGQIAYPDGETDFVRACSIRYSVPEWMIENWLSDYGRERTEEILEGICGGKPLSIRTNLSRISPERLKEKLEAEGVRVEPVGGLSYAFYLSGFDYLNSLQSFRDGDFYVQDVSSMRVAELAGVKPGDHVIDVCAAPGGKSTHIAQMLSGTGMVEARDLTEYKVGLIRDNIEKFGLSNIRVVQMDARVEDRSSVNTADVLICDLPCSGLGVMGKKTDIRYRMTREQAASLASLQRQILTAVWSYVKPGGTLVYSTCTIRREENEDNIAWFTATYPSFRLVCEEQIFPDGKNGDGFFLAKLVREETDMLPRKTDEFPQKTDIKSMTFPELAEFVSGLGEKPFRAKQIYEWLHIRQVDSFEQMTNLSKELRARLEESCKIVSLRQETVQISRQDGTRKYLFALDDGNVIESVLMRYKHGNSVCISSQVGCRMGCAFCASTIGGLVRGMTASEMLDQVYRIGLDIGERISNVVVMGTGEPLDNFENLVKFIEMLTDEHGLHISQRNLTVSTCGIVPEIRRLADCQFAITLALSLHASSQEKRRELMPIANRYDLCEVMDACKYYFEKTGRRVTFEYSLIAGVNDGDEDAKRLCALLGGMNCHINLIPVNPVTERSFSQPDTVSTAAFLRKLEKGGLNATIRRTLGSDIDGSCGQLRRKYIEG